AWPMPRASLRRGLSHESGSLAEAESSGHSDSSDVFADMWGAFAGFSRPERTPRNLQHWVDRTMDSSESAQTFQDQT
ncbi:unnamed protein product, partial [Effrenium voratum]